MVLMPDRSAAPDLDAPFAAFCAPRDLLADALPLLRPASRITVTDAAEMHVRVPLGGVWSRFDRTVTPYMVEPADTTRSRRFRAGAFVGPKQSGKTVMLQTVAMHAVTCDPDPVRIVHMDKRSADQWVEEKLDPMIQNSPEIRARLGLSREDSTFSRKRFKGMRITIGYPVASFLSSTSQRFVLLTDYDHMPQVLGPKDSPENSPYRMARDRTTSFMSRGFVLVESTPAFPVTDPLWRAGLSGPHELPPVSDGIVRVYNDGTRGRWYWECPDCAGIYEPHFTRLRYDATLDPGEAGARAEMECPHCGSLLAHRHKIERNRLALTGRGGWLHEGAVLDEDGRRALVRLDDAALRETDVASWSLNGAAAAFGTWADLVTSWQLALRQFEAFGDATELRGVYYTDRGEPYVPPDGDGEAGLTVARLRDHVQDVAQGVAPAWARFVTTSIDVQGNRFEVLVTAWGPQGQRIVIDRFALTQPAADAPAARDAEGRPRAVDPGRYAEDADLLVMLATRVYAVDGAAYGLRPCALAVDFNGPAGWSDNAEAFWRRRRKTGQGHLWFLSIGRGGFAQRDRVWYAAPERGSKGKAARAIKLLNMSTDRLKDSVLAALGRLEGGVGAFHLPRWLSTDHLGELLAEVRGPKGYDKRASNLRNESLDLSVQALALAEHKGLHRINWDSPPVWAIGGAENSHAVPLDLALASAPAPAGAEAGLTVAAPEPLPAPPLSAPQVSRGRRRMPAKLF